VGDEAGTEEEHKSATDGAGNSRAPPSIDRANAVNGESVSTSVILQSPCQLNQWHANATLIMFGLKSGRGECIPTEGTFGAIDIVCAEVLE